jgi:hypothetical protein
MSELVLIAARNVGLLAFGISAVFWAARNRK